MHVIIAPALVFLIISISQFALGQEDLQTINSLLMRQIEFLDNGNSRLISTFNLFLIVLGALLGGSVIAAFAKFQAIVKEAKQDIDERVEEEVKKHLGETLRGRVEQLEKVIERENVIDRTRLVYCNHGSPEIPPELHQLEMRGFCNPQFLSEVDRTPINTDVLVLDIRHELAEKGDIIATIQHAGEVVGEKTVLVIYVDEYVAKVAQFAKVFERAIIANMSITLGAATVDAAHYVDYLKNSHANALSA